jgi:hypothetical protein
MEMDERIHHHTKPLKFLKLTVALRDCKPTDSRYSSLALGMNLLGMGVKPNAVEYTKKTCESPKKFRHKLKRSVYLAKQFGLTVVPKDYWFLLRCKILFLAGDHLLMICFDANNQFV